MGRERLRKFICSPLSSGDVTSSRFCLNNRTSTSTLNLCVSGARAPTSNAASAAVLAVGRGKDRISKLCSLFKPAAAGRTGQSAPGEVAFCSEPHPDEPQLSSSTGLLLEADGVMGGRRGAKKDAVEVETSWMLFSCSSGCIGCFYHLFSFFLIH